MNPPRYKLRCLDWNAAHVRFALFDPAGANCGQLHIATRDVLYFLATAWTGDLYWQDRLPDDAVANPQKYGGRLV